MSKADINSQLWPGQYPTKKNRLIVLISSTRTLLGDSRKLERRFMTTSEEMGIALSIRLL